MVKVKLKGYRVWLKCDPPRLRAKYDLAKVYDNGTARNGNLSPVKQVVGVVVVKELVCAVVRASILPRSLGNVAATVHAATGWKLRELNGR